MFQLMLEMHASLVVACKFTNKKYGIRLVLRNVYFAHLGEKTALENEHSCGDHQVTDSWTAE